MWGSQGRLEKLTDSDIEPGALQQESRPRGLSVEFPWLYPVEIGRRFHRMLAAPAGGVCVKSQFAILSTQHFSFVTKQSLVST